MDAALDAILKNSDESHLISFDGLLDNAIAASSAGMLVSILKRITAEDVSLQVAKVVTARMAVKLTSATPTVFEEFCSQVLPSLKNIYGTYDEADFVLRDHLFGVYVQWGHFSDAAQSLGGLNLESTVRVYSEQQKADIHIKCAEAYLEDGAFVDAEVFVNKASPFINSVSDISIILRYRATFAKVLDSNRKFIEAALRYYELSTTTNANIDPDDLLELLAKAVTCAILGKTGPPRTRVLGLLSKDERISSLDYLPKYSSHSIILNKMYREQIIRKEELKVFEAVLIEHQKALTADGFTILEKAIIEHNMLATGKIYDNIHISELANILLVDERRAEKVAAIMIGEGRLKGIIDQVENLLIFESRSDTIAKFNMEISNICDEVQMFVDAVR